MGGLLRGGGREANGGGIRDDRVGCGKANWTRLEIAAVDGKEENGVFGENGAIVEEVYDSGQGIGSIFSSKRRETATQLGEIVQRKRWIVHTRRQLQLQRLEGRSVSTQRRCIYKHLFAMQCADAIHDHTGEKQIAVGNAPTGDDGNEHLIPVFPRYAVNTDTSTLLTRTL